MKPNNLEVHKQHAFDSYCKKILKNEVRDIQDEYHRRRAREVYFSELSVQELDQIKVIDEYFAEEHIFDVLVGEISVSGNLVAEALQTLPEQKRDIILLSYFLDMTDGEIAKKLHLVRSTFQHQRTSSLKELKKYMEGKADY